MERRSYTLAEAAEVLGFGETTLRAHIHPDGDRIEFDSGQQLPILRLGGGGRIRIPVAAVDRLLGDHQAAS